jgi:hypothetical protein
LQQSVVFWITGEKGTRQKWPSDARRQVLPTNHWEFLPLLGISDIRYRMSDIGNASYGSWHLISDI